MQGTITVHAPGDRRKIELGSFVEIVTSANQFFSGILAQSDHLGILIAPTQKMCDNAPKDSTITPDHVAFLPWSAIIVVAVSTEL